MTTYFTILCYDASNSKSIRMDKLDEHMQHMQHMGRVIEKVAVASPLKDDDANFIGSLVVVQADNKAEAEKLLKDDPYYQAGVWERYDIFTFGPAAGEWVGHISW